MDAYLVSHTGLGDNLFMVGAINYIKLFYKNVYFFCKSRNYNNAKLFFGKNSNVTCLPFNGHGKTEINEIKKYINDDLYKNDNIDIFICGNCIKPHFKSKITNNDYLNHKIIYKNYNLKCSNINNSNYAFIENFYKDIKLNLTHFYEYFDLPPSDISKTLFDSVSNYYLVFIQLKCSNGAVLNISNLLNKYKSDDKVLLICNDVNLYDETDKNYSLANKFVMLQILDYLDIIKNSDEIYLIDSCFIGIVMPLFKTNRLKTTKIEIILRSQVNKHIL
jgi:hypothetical protein